MIQESIYLEDDKKKINLGESKSAFVPPDPNEYYSFNPAQSVIVRDISI